MFTRTRICSIVLAGAICLGWGVRAWSQAAAGVAKDYQIKMSRSVKVGQTFRYTASGSEKSARTITTGGKAMTKRDDLAFEVNGIREILTTDEKGEATKVALTIDACVKIEGDKRTEVASKGTVAIISAADGRKDVQAKDPNVTLSAEAARILKTAIQVHTAPGNDDDAFGTDKRQRVGDSWPVNSEFMAQSFSRMLGKEGALRKEDVTGRTTLRGLTKVEGFDCLHLSADVAIKNFIPPVPPGATVEKGDVTVSETGNLPIDQSIPMLGGERTMTSSIMMKVKGPDGAEITVEIKTEGAVTETIIPIRK